jgi:hypothetical protein
MGLAGKEKRADWYSKFVVEGMAEADEAFRN